MSGSSIAWLTWRSVMKRNNCETAVNGFYASTNKSSICSFRRNVSDDPKIMTMEGVVSGANRGGFVAIGGVVGRFGQVGDPMSEPAPLDLGASSLLLVYHAPSLQRNYRWIRILRRGRRIQVCAQSFTGNQPERRSGHNYDQEEQQACQATLSDRLHRLHGTE